MQTLDQKKEKKNWNKEIIITPQRNLINGPTNGIKYNAKIHYINRFFSIELGMNKLKYKWKCKSVRKRFDFLATLQQSAQICNIFPLHQRPAPLIFNPLKNEKAIPKTIHQVEGKEERKRGGKKGTQNPILNHHINNPYHYKTTTHHHQISREN